MKTFGALSWVGDHWVMGGDIPPHVLIKLKAVFTKIPKAAEPPYRFQGTLDNASDLAWFDSRYPFGMSNVDRITLETMARRHAAVTDELDLILGGDYAPRDHVGLTEGSVVRPYQGIAVEVLARSMGLLLGDDLGLGKTFAGAASLLLPGALPGIVLCPGHLQKQWVKVLSGDKETRAFTNLKAFPINTTRPHLLPPADVFVFRYSQLIGWADYWSKIKPGLVIYDEAQELRTGVGTENEPVQKGLSARRLSRAAKMRLGLTATPIYGYGTEIFNVMSFIDPKVLGEREDFEREWADGGKSIKDPEALGSYLRDQHVFLRRTKRDVGQNMPAVNRIIEPIDYDQKVVHDAETLARQLAIKATSGVPTQRGQAVRELDILMRQQTGIAKARGIANFVRILVEAGQPVVVGLWHREVYAIVMKNLEDLKPAMYTGSESNSRKAAAVQAFLSGETDVFLISLRSGAGLDGLQRRSSTMVIGELDWSPGVHDQLIGRLDREHQTEPVTAFFLVAEEGSDPPMMEVLGLKASEANAIVNPGLGPQIVHSDSSKLQSLVQRYLQKKTAVAA